MQCPSCGQGVEEEQKFCQNCGQSLAGITNATQPLNITPAPDPPDEFRPGDSDGGATGITEPNAAEPMVPVATASGAASDIADLPTSEISPREPIPEPDWATPTGEVATATSDVVAPSSDDSAARVDLASTTQIPAQQGVEATANMGTMPVQPGGTDELPAVFDGSGEFADYPEQREPFTLKLVFVFALFGAIATLMSAVADVIDIRTSTPVDGIATGVRTLDTLGTNLAVAGFFGATVMTLGALLACFGFRWGAGLAGGAGLALVGWSALIIGLAELRITLAESKTRQTTDIAFTLKVTRDLGFWLVVAVAVIGLLVFIASLRSIGNGGRPALNPWIAAVGAVAGVVLVAGPLLPEGDATFANNFRSAATVGDLPTAYFAGRLIQLALIGFTVVFGLLIVRPYGLGLATGGVSVATWMWSSSLLEFGAFDLGIAAGNFGASDSAPHAVTSVGMALTLVMLVVAAILALIGSQRRRRIGH